VGKWASVARRPGVPARRGGGGGCADLRERAERCGGFNRAVSGGVRRVPSGVKRATKNEKRKAQNGRESETKKMNNERRQIEALMRRRLPFLGFHFSAFVRTVPVFHFSFFAFRSRRAHTPANSTTTERDSARYGVDGIVGADCHGTMSCGEGWAVSIQRRQESALVSVPDAWGNSNSRFSQ
jgi:hypothetical protein